MTKEKKLIDAVFCIVTQLSPKLVVLLCTQKLSIRYHPEGPQEKSHSKSQIRSTSLLSTSVLIIDVTMRMLDPTPSVLMQSNLWHAL